MTTLTSNPPAALNPAGSPPTDEPLYFGVRAGSWLKAGSIAALFVLLFWPNLRRLWEKTNPFTGEPNWGHAIAIPFIGLYYLYINRDRLRAAGTRPAWSGLGIALAGILIFGYGIWPGQNDWFKDVGMVITLFGIVTLLCGWEAMKTAWFPIAFLICALPWPGLVYSYVAGPLQQLAASVAVKVLHLAGVESGQFGTKIFIVGNNYAVRTLNVAEACAGLRSLMTFVSVAAAWAFLFPRAMWQRLILVVSAVPIAIFCNVMRVSGQGLLDRYVSPQLSESFAHQFVGLVMLIPAFFLILLVGWILQNIFIEEMDDKAALKANAAASAARKPASTVVRRAAPTPAARSVSAEPVLAAPLAPTPNPVSKAPSAPPAATVTPPRPAMIPPRPAGLTGAPRAPRPRATPPQSNPPGDRASQEKP